MAQQFPAFGRTRSIVYAVGGGGIVYLVIVYLILRRPIPPGFWGEIGVLIAVLAFAFGVVFDLDRLSRKMVPAQDSVRLTELPAAFAVLRKTGRDGSFFVLGLPPARGRRASGQIFLQYSIEGGRAGLDWVLTDAPAALRDREKFTAFVRGLGFEPAEREMNGFKYLRVEDGDLAGLGKAVAIELYGLPADARLELTAADRFEWPGRK